MRLEARNRMHFSIDTEACNELGSKDPEDSTTSEAIESAYRHGSAVRINFGEQTWARLPVSGGVSDIYDDIIRMLKRLEVDAYPFELSFLCSCFTAIWRFSASNGSLTIDMRWTAVDGTARGCVVRNSRFNDVASQLVVDKQVFISAWRTLLSQLKRDLLSVGYDRHLDNFEYLDSLGC